MTATEDLTERFQQAAAAGEIRHNEQFTLLTAVHESKHAKVVELLDGGCPPRFAVMLATKRAPGLHGTTTGFQAMGTGDMDDGIAKRLKRNGYTANASDKYFPEYAAYPGDPRAVLSGTNDFNDLQNYVRERGIPCDGVVKSSYVPPREDPQSKRKKLGADIVDMIYDNAVSQNPDLVVKDATEVKREIVEKHSL